MKVINRWHTMLNMPKYDEAWHRQDMQDELEEYYEARGFIDVWSELSDVVYTYTRAKWSGYTTITFPFSRIKFFFGLLYMFPKYTLRWRFFRALGHQFDKDLNISEVRNPKKIQKLRIIAEKYSLDQDRFTEEAIKLMRRHIFLR